MRPLLTVGVRGAGLGAVDGHTQVSWLVLAPHQCCWGRRGRSRLRTACDNIALRHEARPTPRPGPCTPLTGLQCGRPGHPHRVRCARLRGAAGQAAPAGRQVCGGCWRRGGAGRVGGGTRTAGAGGCRHQHACAVHPATGAAPGAQQLHPPPLFPQSLPEEVRARYEDPESSYNFGCGARPPCAERPS